MQSVAHTFGYQQVASEYAGGFGLALTVLARPDVRRNVQVVPRFPLAHPFQGRTGHRDCVPSRTGPALYQFAFAIRAGQRAVGPGIAGAQCQPTVTFLVGDLNYRAASPTAFNVLALRPSDQLHPTRPGAAFDLVPGSQRERPAVGAHLQASAPAAHQQPDMCDGEVAQIAIASCFQRAATNKTSTSRSWPMSGVDLPALNGTDHAAVWAVFELPSTDEEAR